MLLRNVHRPMAYLHLNPFPANNSFGQETRRNGLRTKRSPLLSAPLSPPALLRHICASRFGNMRLPLSPQNKLLAPCNNQPRGGLEKLEKHACTVRVLHEYVARNLQCMLYVDTFPSRDP